MLDKYNIVQKSRPLLSLSKSELSIYELKVLDTYLSRIDSHKPEQREVTFEKGEFEELFDFEEMQTPVLKKHLDVLQSLRVDISKNENETDKIVLFSRARAVKDKYGLWKVTLTCSTEAMKYFFKIENLGYLRYKLMNVLQLNSRYSYLLFLYLVDNRFRKQWKIDVDELKAILNCTNESYTGYNNFGKVLQRCKEEILSKTDIIFDFSTIKRGRFVKDIQFKVKTWGELATIPTEEETDSIIDADAEERPRNANIRIMRELAPDIQLDEIQVIYDMLLQLDIDDNIHGTGIINYFKYLLDRFKVADSKKPIRNKTAYLKKMIANEIEGKQQ